VDPEVPGVGQGGAGVAPAAPGQGGRAVVLQVAGPQEHQGHADHRGGGRRARTGGRGHQPVQGLVQVRLGQLDEAGGQGQAGCQRPDLAGELAGLGHPGR
jgi:hypothetical protein